MRTLVILLTLFVSVWSQYPGQLGVRPDVVFDERADRFDLGAINMAPEHPKQSRSFRRKLKDPFLQKVVDKINHFRKGFQDFSNTNPTQKRSRRQLEIEKINNDVNNEGDVNMDDVNDRMMNRLVEGGASKQDDDQNTSANDDKETKERNKEEYLNSLKNFARLGSSRRSLVDAIVNKLHNADARKSSVDMTAINELMMHYAFPLKLTMNGYIVAPDIV